MDCEGPFIKAGQAYPCGKCLPCKFRQRRIWHNRVLLEASQHDYSSAVTLTYDEAAVPEDGELHPEHLRNWLKRFRKRALERYPWRSLRFFAAGEYGEAKGRPHYHVVLFGQPGCENGRTGSQWCGDCGCINCCDVVETWGLGACSVESMSEKVSAYICGYVTRKVLTECPVGKKVKPFLRMSNRGGIGASAMMDVASEMLRYGLERRGVPLKLRIGDREMLLGRYLRRKLGEYVGEEVVQVPADECVQSVFDYAWNNSLNPREVFRAINEGYASQLAQREALKPKGGLHET